jgi:hypothetical protein
VTDKLVLPWGIAANFVCNVAAAVMVGETLPQFEDALLPRSAVVAGMALYAHHLALRMDHIAEGLDDPKIRETFQYEVDLVIADLARRIEHIFEGRLL